MSQTPGNFPASFSWLPDELWHHIFDEVDAMTMAKTSLINSEFYDKTWRKYVRTVTLAGESEPNPVLRQLRRTLALEHLHLQELPELADEDIEFITKLTVLSNLSIISCVNITNAAFTTIATLTQLTELQIGEMPHITDESLRQVSQLSKLASLTCYRIPKITDASMEALLGPSNKLKTLLLHECDMVSTAPLHHLTRMRELKIVSISGMDRVRPHIWTFLRDLSSLEELSLSCGLTDDGVAAHLPSLSSLKILNLSWNNMTDQGLQHISALENLEYLDLSKIGSLSGQVFEHFTRLTNLRSLLLTITEQMTPNDMSIISRFLPTLEYLTLSEAMNDSWCHALASSTFTNLRHLFLEASDAITDSGCQSLGSLAQLESLSMSGIEITYRGLSAALKPMEHLTYLDLHSCHMLDDEAVIESLSHLGGLVHLYLNNNSGLTDRCLDVLESLHLLDTLSIAKCPNFTSKAVQLMATLAPQLSFIDISFCGGITNDAVNYIEQMHNLQFFYADGTRITHSGLKKLRTRLEEYSASPDPKRRCTIS